MNINPMFLIDAYKADHRNQYPSKTQMIYSNFTPRKSRVEGVENVVVFGIQYFVMEYLIDRWKREFFEKDINEIELEYKEFFDSFLGPDSIETSHIRELHELGYLPLLVKALPEGTIAPIGVPVLTIRSTNENFAWLTNYIETLMSNILWKPMTSATTAHEYRKVFDEYAEKTGYDPGFVSWQGHDFSYRGMGGLEDAVMSGAAHLLSFTGTDTIPAVHFLKRYYGADYKKILVGGSVPATEHSVMCLSGKETEIETFRRLINEVYPKGIVSIVSDTWDFWQVMTEFVPAIKEDILRREGRVVFRPDSGNPVDIICGVEAHSYKNQPGVWYNEDGRMVSEAEVKGAYEVLWDIFGGTINEKGYKVLHPSVGLIYGDSITLSRQKEILERLERKGFSASNLVLGIGSFTYEYVTRDTYGFAMKATAGIVDGEFREIFKDPKTDSGMKKSAKGLLKVYRALNGKIVLKDQCTPEEEESGMLQPVFCNGRLMNKTTLSEIRERLKNS